MGGVSYCIYCSLLVGKENVKDFIERNIINALDEVQFAAAHWDKLGLQLSVPPHKITTIM